MNTSLPYYTSEPPARLKKARLDNIALVPASLLPLKTQYQPLANRLPKGSVLLVQTQSPRQNRILEKVAAYLRTHSRQVITLPIERITRMKHQRKTIHAQTVQLAFRADENSHLYRFTLHSNGFYELYLSESYQDKKSQTLAQGHVAINRYQYNLLTVIARESDIYLYVNRQYITHVSDSTFNSGEVGLFAYDTANPTEVTFRNAQVWRL